MTFTSSTETTYTAGGQTGQTFTFICEDLPNGTVERRIIAFFCEPIKRTLYDLASMKLGRDTREAEVFKDAVRDIMRETRKVAYDLLNDHMDHSTGITVDDIIEVLLYVFPEKQDTGLFYSRLEELVTYAFGQSAKGTNAYFKSRIRYYIQNRIPRIRSNYQEEWDGARSHILKKN